MKEYLISNSSFLPHNTIDLSIYFSSIPYTKIVIQKIRLAMEEQVPQNRNNNLFSY